MLHAASLKARICVCWGLLTDPRGDRLDSEFRHCVESDKQHRLK